MNQSIAPVTITNCALLMKSAQCFCWLSCSDSLIAFLNCSTAFT